MKIIFAGTPEFSCPILQALLDAKYEIMAVYTQPDRPKGRGQHQQMSAVKQLALTQHLRIEQPTTLRDKAVIQRLKDYAPDILVVVAYGLLLPKAVLDIPSFGAINVHASLLPRWRGAAPIQRAILAGDQKTGVSIMKMVEALDAGDVLAMAEIPITRDDTAASLHDHLARLGAELLLSTLSDIERGQQVTTAQNTQLVTYAKKIMKEEAKIDWHRDALFIERQIRAYFGWPVAFTYYKNKLLRIWQGHALNETSDFEPGSLIAVNNELRVVCGNGMLRLDKIQLEGARVVSAADFLNARRADILQEKIIL